MNKATLITAAVTTWLHAAACFGHGNPIHVDVADGRLVVSGDFHLDNGFVDLAFDSHEDAFLDTAPGNNLGDILPGYEINGMEVGSQLRLEVLSRPDFTMEARPQRWLWFWDEATGKVGVADNDPVLELASQRLFGSVLLTQFAAPSSGPSMQVAEPRALDLGTHQHPILYLLDNDPPAPSGVYGFFLRLTSPNYLPSAPFLVALNHTDPGNFATGATHINAAARLPGDFDGDDEVDGADFLLWQQTLGSTSALTADASLNSVIDAADLAIWREGYGDVYIAPGAEPVSTAVPEPATWTFAAMAATLLARHTSAPGFARGLRKATRCVLQPPAGGRG